MAITVSIGIGTNTDVAMAAHEAAMRAKQQLDAEAIHLCLVFTTINLAKPVVLKTIKRILPDTPLVGCSTLGVITEKQIYRHAVAVLLVSLPKDAYIHTDCVQEISLKSSVRAGEELGNRLIYALKNAPRNFGTIFSDGLIQDNSSFLAGLQESLGKSFPIIGACASDNLKFIKTCVYTNDAVFNDGACGVIWGGKLHFGVGIRHGWRPLGKPHYVTHAIKNTIYSIDNAPAASLYKEYLSTDLATLRKDLKHISALYPIGIDLPAEEEYLLRNTVSIEDTEAIICQGEIPQGSTIRLMIGTKESCLAATRKAAEDVKNALRGKSCDFLLVFESTSRYTLLGRQANNELRIIKEVLGEKLPILGIYTYGEQAPLRAIGYHGIPYFHNQSITILGIGN
ncbi:MAG: FIST C-terminal domain-containing protein [Candidatus Omnitrophica bacterium]|nr:FIST C-terminal domain-containing protein [Candidatus Omnitrophota bacterium]